MTRSSIMTHKLRIWRVVPVRNGVQAPTFFLETTEDGRENAEEAAIKQARLKSGLSMFAEWKYRLEKLPVRVDKFGRYVTYHQ